MKRYHDDTLSVATAIQRPESPLTIQAVPNPAHDRVRLLQTPPDARAFALRDATGRASLTGPIVHGFIDLGSLSTGCYLLDVLDAHGARLGLARVVKM